MAGLSRPRDPDTMLLPPREAIVAADTDVLVVGGGPAGMGAAVGAAAAGARVVLVERYGFLGGNATAALVMPLMSFHTHREAYEAQGVTTLMPTDHGPGEPVIGGVLRQFLERLLAAGGAIEPSLSTGFTVPFDPEIFKLVALDLLADAGVDVLLHAFASGVILEGRTVTGVVFETKSGPIVVRCGAAVDCTGDGDIAARAGARYDIGRDHDRLVQPMTLMFRMVGFDHGEFDAYVRQHPEQWRGVHGLWDLVRRAAEAGELDLPREDILFFGTPNPGEIAVNSTRVTGARGIDVWDLTRAEIASRYQMQQIAAFLRRMVPGFERSYVAQSGVQIGVRETRRIHGLYQLTADDILTARKFGDGIARGTYPIDVHNPSGRGTVLRRVPPGEAYDVPLRCLIPDGVEGLLVAGRCISGTHEAHASYRVMPISMATGHAAGIAAALAARGGQPPRVVQAEAVRDELRRQAADVGPG